MLPFIINKCETRFSILLIFMKGRKTKKGINNLTKETKLESSPVRFPFISPKENAQIIETINK